MDMLEILKSYYPVRRMFAPALVGQPGIGKTQVVHQLKEWVRENTEFTDCKVWLVNLNGKAPNEIVGMSMPDHESRTMEVFDCGIFTRCKAGDIVLFDELLTASPACLNTILTLVESRVLPSGDPIPDVMLIAAANPLPSPERISEATRDRFEWYEIEWNRNTWKEFIKRKYGVDPTNKVMNLVRWGAKQYNVRTPRRITKYIEWLSDNCPTRKERFAVYQIIEREFDINMSDAFKDMFENRSKNEQMFEAFKEIGIQFSEPGAVPAIKYGNSTTMCVKPIEEMDAAELLESLTKLPEWEEICAKLEEYTIE